MDKRDSNAWAKTPEGKAWYSTYQKEYYKRNRSKMRKQCDDRKKAIRQWVDEIKAAKGCSRCPEKHPATLDFHHIDPKIKNACISEMKQKGCSREVIQSEIDKCELICANCHRKEHYNEKFGAWQLAEKAKA